MFPIIETKEIAKNVYLQRIQAPRVAKKRKAGQFLVLRRTENGERIPLTIVSSDVGEGSVTIIFQAVGKSTTEFARMQPGDGYLDVVGPLGLATHIEQFGTVVGIGGGSPVRRRAVACRGRAGAVDVRADEGGDRPALAGRPCRFFRLIPGL